MSTWEKFTKDYSPCPCGKGQILEIINSADNGWSRPYSEYKLSCGDCAKEWELDLLGTELVNREASKACSAARDQIHAVEAELTAIGSEAVQHGNLEDRISELSAKRDQLKAEWDRANQRLNATRISSLRPAHES